MAVRKARELRLRRHNRVRRKVDGTSARPLVAASSHSEGVAQGTKSVEAHSVGQLIAAKAKAAGISLVVFDRGGFKYHGRVQALADGAREGGLEF
jgi:large subunit ribosomal protein L18